MKEGRSGSGEYFYAVGDVGVAEVGVPLRYLIDVAAQQRLDRK